MFYFGLSPGAKGFPSLLEALEGCQGCSQQWDAHPMELICSTFHEVVSNGLKHYCCHAAKPKQGWK